MVRVIPTGGNRETAAKGEEKIACKEEAPNPKASLRRKDIRTTGVAGTEKPKHPLVIRGE